MSEQPFAGSLGPGTKLGKYEIREQVATGGMAMIYQAYDPSLDRLVAIKQIAPHLARDDRFAERFRTEAQTLARLSATQSNIVNVYELIEEDGHLFLVMEYVEGTTLRAMLDRGAVPLQTGMGVLLSTALGLKAMHGAGIVHRDLKPLNLMMARDGALKVTDFGLIGHSGGRTSLPMGTTKYMAPEMFTGAPVDPRTDIYSLGMIAYEMFLGPEQFAEVFKDVLRDERAEQVRWMHWHSNPSLRVPPLKDLQPGIPPLISKIVQRMMEKEPSRRFGSVDQIIRWLRRIFVMTVKGQSLSVADSQALEKELETEASAVPTPAPAAAGAPTPAPRPVPARRPMAGGAGGGEGQAEGDAPSGEAEKTAPLPVPKWTWKKAAIVSAAIVGPLMLALVALLIWRSHTTQHLTSQARVAMEEADDAYDAKNWADAADAYGDIVREFAELEWARDRAAQRYYQAKAEAALAEKAWSEAERAHQQATEAGAKSDWRRDFRTKLQSHREVQDRVARAKEAEESRNYEEAIALLRELVARFGNSLPGRPDIDPSSWIGQLDDRIVMGEYRTWVTRGKSALDQGALEPAMTAFQEARQIRETPEVTDLIEQVKNEKAFREYYAQAEQALADERWSDAREYYEKALAIRTSKTAREKLDRARVMELKAQAKDIIAAAPGMTEAIQAIYTKVLQINPQDPDALNWMRQQNVAQQIEGYIKAGDEKMAAQAWAEAVPSYEQALKLMDASHPDRARVEAERDKAQYNMYVDQAREAIDAKEWSAAELAIGKARGVKDAPELATLETQIDQRREYYLHLDTAKTLYSQSSFVEALREFKAAQQIWDTQEVRDLVVDTDYRRYLVKGRYYLEQGELQKAMAFLNLAKEQKPTPEVEGYIQEVQRRQEEEASTS